MNATTYLEIISTWATKPIGVGFFGAKGLNPFRSDLSEFVNEYMGGGKNTCSLRTYFVGSF